MLQTLRDKTSGWIATVILGLLVVPFAFFGMEQYLFQRNDTFAAKIEAPPKWWPAAPAAWPVTMLWQHDEIGADEFRSAFERARQQQRQQQGEQFDARAFETVDSKRKVLETLIDQRVLQLTARHQRCVGAQDNPGHPGVPGQRQVRRAALSACAGLASAGTQSAAVPAGRAPEPGAVADPD
jgi:peptidyl-prolyl cis-trans isomerase D